jgi:hypothetical protein
MDAGRMALLGCSHWSVHQKDCGLEHEFEDESTVGVW